MGGKITSPYNYYALVSDLSHRHDIQSLSSPLIVNVIPTNTHPPRIIPSIIYLDFTENTKLNLLAGVGVNDTDVTCEEPIIVAARIEIQTVASDNAQEMLEVYAFTVGHLTSSDVIWMMFVSVG